MRTPILETDRLVLRPFKEDDVADVFECWESDPDVAKYMFWTSHNDIEKTREWITFELNQIEKQDWYRFAIVLKDTNTLIGTALVYYEEEVECWEIGYNLGKKYWGKGYTTEAMKRVIEFATEELKLSQIVGRYAKENPASGRVMTKLGFKYEKDIPYECNNGAVKREGIQCRLNMRKESLGMDIRESIKATKRGFEDSFATQDFYNKQTQDEQHLDAILDFLPVKTGMKILDLGTGSGYLSFAIAKKYPEISVVGLDIVENALENNRVKAKEENINNLVFVTYDGIDFPFADQEFDMVISRYALHHFPDIQKSISEVSRILNEEGLFFVSDPTPNDNDSERFVDAYMQLKKDGHIKFYTVDEWKDICKKFGMDLCDSFDSSIRFPKKKDTAYGFEELLNRYDKDIISGYELEIVENEIYVTERVNNLLFCKEG